MQKWTKETAGKRLREILLEYGDITVARYQSLDIPDKPGETTLRRYFGSWSKAVAGVSETPDGKYLAKQNERLLKRLDRQKDITQAFVDNCLASIEKISFTPAKVPKKVHAKENQEFHAIRSDAHVGETVDPKWTQGIGHYGFEVYKSRLDRWTERLLLFKEQDERFLGLNKLVLCYLGDQVTGEGIFSGQAFYLDLSLTDQLFQSLECETNAILSLAERFNEIEIFCVVGNHGRPGRKGDNHHRTNFDYIFYRSLQSGLHSQKNVKVFVSESPSMIIKHGNFVFLLNHGDNARGWAGIPYYGLERMFRRLPGLYEMVINYELVGHHHQPANIADKVFMNGSMVGGSDLSINRMGLTNLPSQKIFYFDRKRGINRESNLYLAEPVKLKPDGNGIFTEYV